MGVVETLDKRILIGLAGPRQNRRVKEEQLPLKAPALSY